MWKGVIIEESLEDKSILEKVSIVKTRKSFDDVTQMDWTMHDVEVSDENITQVAELAVNCIKKGWWVDFRKDKTAYIILKNKIFNFTNEEIEKQKEAQTYAISVGVDPRQADFTKYFTEGT